MPTNSFEKPCPDFSDIEIQSIASKHFGLEGNISPLVSERDQNARIKTVKGSFVLKIANADEDADFLTFQNEALKHLHTTLPNLPLPRLISAKDRNDTVLCHTKKDAHIVRALTYIEGSLFSMAPKTPALYTALGQYVGKLSRGLKSFGHVGAHRPNFLWNLDNVLASEEYIADIADAANKELIQKAFAHYKTHIQSKVSSLPAAVIHNDINDNNIVITDDNISIAGVIDFGDMVFARQVNELAITLAYALLDQNDILGISGALISAYVAEFPLQEEEAEVLFDLVIMRLAMSVCISSHRAKSFPDNEYLLVSQAPAFRLLQQLKATTPKKLIQHTRLSCGFNPVTATHMNTEPIRSLNDMVAKRNEVLAPSLSLSYKNKLNITRGAGAYLFDHENKPFLDCVNNVCHVGHCHPHVTQALTRQAITLNTNTRYLHDTIQRYAARLLATMPSPLSVVYFVCSGSEANELALRLARTKTGRDGVVAVDWAYHGNTSSLIDISPYKFNRKGGNGCPDHVRIAEIPDPYRGRLKGYDSINGKEYAKSVAACIDDLQSSTGVGPAAFIAESIAGVGGQVIFPENYLKHAYKAARTAGTICIADEVQTGFGRVGTHMWAFEQQDVVPDIVTLGKPIGNGHPMAAVVTTREIANTFANGMEFFNTFGGNPVSCAVGMAVLDVLEMENLQVKALETGDHLLKGFHNLQDKHALIGDVRGSGLFLGIELVNNHKTLEPASDEACKIVEFCRLNGILLSTDGPLENVIKIKPPMVFGIPEADALIATLDQAFETL